VTRTSRLLVTGALAALVLTGCGDGTVRTGAAATVGDDRITTSTLEKVVSRSLADPSAQQTVGSDRPAFERTVLARLVQHTILTAAAEAEGVTVSGGDIDAVQDRLAAQLGGQAQLEAEALKAGISKQDLRQALADAALRDALGDKLTASIEVPEEVLKQAYQQGIADYDKVHSAHILVASKAQAQAILAQVRANPSQFDALAARFSTDTSNKDNGGDLGFQGRGALEKPFEDAIFNNKPGSFVVAQTRFGFHVIHVIERRTTTFEQARNELRRNLLGQQRQVAVSSLLVKTAKRLGVHVNPRFGVWDAPTQDVVEATTCPDSAISSPSPRAPADGGAAAPEPSATPDCP
jgi:foldase protein PrsA